MDTYITMFRARMMPFQIRHLNELFCFVFSYPSVALFTMCIRWHITYIYNLYVKFPYYYVFRKLLRTAIAFLGMYMVILLRNSR